MYLYFRAIYNCKLEILEIFGIELYYFINLYFSIFISILELCIFKNVIHLEILENFGRRVKFEN